ncbi:MAG: zinc ribbon domain-containing protein [Clostridiales bacterium]|jgi:ribosomal protein L37AE/L43A|nr:zinc ribbon domain-containing protein [Clostridiales bacterium]
MVKKFGVDVKASQDKSIALDEPSEAICRKCGQRLKEGVLFCTHCGAKRGGFRFDPEDDLREPPKSK